jgi:mannose-6-phosphate isomerase-like protein (cupin superfamily)
MAKDDWNAFELEEQIELQRKSGHPYHEFLRVPALSCGVYTLTAGAKDLQAPHDEDEVYFVVRGRGRVRVAGEERPIGPGSILYVRATSDHSFFEIEEEITLLVFFGSGGPG